MAYEVAEGLRVAAAYAALFLVPGALYARWLLEDVTWSEATVVGGGAFTAATVTLLMVAHLALQLPMVAATGIAVWLALLVPLLAAGAARLGRGVLVPPRRPAWERRPLERALVLLGLAVVALAASYWAALPHIANGFAPPFHVDEWIHWARTRAMVDAGTLRFGNAFLGDAGSGLNLTDETGFWVLTALLHWLGGLSFPTIWRYGPLAQTAILSLAAYAYGARAHRPFGWEAALLVPLIPTTIRLLGPGFYVPMPVVLWFALAAAIATHQPDRRRGLPLVALLAVGGLLVHSATAGVVALLAGWHLLLRVDDRRTLGRALLAAAGFAVVFLLVVNLVPFLDRMWERLLVTLTEVQDYPNTKVQPAGGYFVTQLTWPVMWLFGAGAVWAFTSRERRAQQALVLALPPLLAFIVLGDRFSRGHTSVYDRSFMYTSFLLLMLAGAGLADVRRNLWRALRGATARLMAWARPGLAERLRGGHRDPATRLLRGLDVGLRQPPATWGAFLAVSLVVSGLGVAAAYDSVHPVKEDEFYYILLSEGQYDTLTWVRDHPEALHGARLALADPQMGLAVAAVTGLEPYAILHPVQRPRDPGEINAFLSGGCRDLEFMDAAGADVVLGARCDWRIERYWQAHRGVHLYLPAFGFANRTEARAAGW